MTIVAAIGLQNIFPVLRYKDANAAIEWLNRVFGPFCEQQPTFSAGV
jgi:uncharacterized glyoxalase superfamily protein PhnB